MKPFAKYQLGAMMFLQFFIWGGWFVTLGTFLANNLGADGGQIGIAFSTQSWGAIIAPFVIGLIADRYFNAERILAILHLLGALLMFLMYRAADFSAFYPAVLAYMVLYMPTLALANSISFRHLADPAREFSGIRVWGTLGWICAGLLISYVFAWDSRQGIDAGQLANTFPMCAAASLLLGLFSLFLPATPPATEKSGGSTLGEILGLKSIGLFRDRNFRVFFVFSILVCIPLAFYYQNTSLFLTEAGMENSTAKMALGQASEVLFMLCVPLFLLRFGIKVTLLAAMLAWAVRYFLFAYGNAGEFSYLLILGIALHGICYDFFFVSGQIYTDSKAEASYRSAAQGLVTLATYGLGMLIGFWIAGWVTDLYALDGGHAWRNIWLLPAAFSLVVFTLFAALFRSEAVATGGLAYSR
ncbi:MFS transporter [Microbulbifer litoralis]|uniref:MFS transporter n=1 Tax=Microbulbifer litoralis TaxID=2933965 RepID=UPI002027EC26|nr:MFS transporter [Microbulbifer sp. GX H0434]